MRQLALFLLFVGLSAKVVGQNGTILQQTPYVFKDSTITVLEKSLPDVRSFVNAVNFYNITYMSDGLKVKGYLSMPKKPGSYPCIIFNRGGNKEFGAINEGTLARIFGEVASWGYVVVGSQYRGNAGGEGKEEFGGSDVDDVLNLLPLLTRITTADTTRVGMLGWSRGGMETYRALTLTCQMKAAVIAGGMADVFLSVKNNPNIDSNIAHLAPGYYQNRDSVLRARSAVYWADKICPTTPLLLLHGSADWRVLPQESFEMVNKLYQLKHPLRFELLEGGQHSIIEHYQVVNTTIRDFLDTYVRDEKKWPSLEPHGN
jgi:dipeptidyl aminopeptidase/acylaminoacyl peptidase